MADESTDWNSLTTLADWAGALHALLVAGEASIRSGDPIERGAAQKRLIEFVLESPNSIAIELDELARGAIDAILLPGKEQALVHLAQHMRELAKHLSK
jgi:hypothetical protein